MKKKINFLILITIVIQFFYIINKKIDFNLIYFKNSFKSEYVGNLKLPKETLEIKAILNNQKKNNFNLSNKIKKNSLIYQRTIEYLYPKKIDNNIDEYFELITENNSNCELIEEFSYTKIVKC